jgi:uncharacterized membrane protein
MRRSTCRTSTTPYARRVKVREDPVAGIGFTLEQMTKGASISVAMSAYLSAALLVSGPWIFTILGIAGASLIVCEARCLEVQIFRSVIIYNSAFSLLVTSPIAFVCTRFVSDRIAVKDYESVTFALVVAVAAFASCAAWEARSISWRRR